MARNNHTGGLLEPLKIALKLEREGRRFFSEAASTVTGSVARHTFLFLAAEEGRHIERIKEFYHSIEKSGESNLPMVKASRAARRLEEFNDRMAELKDEIHSSLRDIEAYRTALKFENGAEAFYAQQAERAQDPRVRQFYRWLILEEGIHSRVLQSCIKFAEDPAGWFRDRS
jgi:rubrerythrin